MKSKVAVFGALTALALIFSYVETLIPISIGIPGAKLGLANLVIVIALYKLGTKEAYLLSIVRIVLAGFLFGNLAAILYSLAGGMLSLAVMSQLKKAAHISIIGVSVAGGVFHNAGQLIIASAVVENFSLLLYFPALMVAGTITGLLIGIISREMLKHIARMEW